MSRAVDAVDALAAEAPAALASINQARAAARAAVWRLAGRHAPDHKTSAEQPLMIAVDGTLVTSHSDKEAARPTFKRGYGHHPLWCSPTTARTGPGSRWRCCCARESGSNTAADHITVLRQALAQLPGHRPGPGPAARSWYGSTAPTQPTTCWTG